MPLYNEFMPYPLLSAFFDGCIKKGKDITNGGALYNTGSFWAVGIPNVGDSLAAIKKVVFEDKKISMDRLIEALEKNFEGYEDIEYILNSAPKFGNDNDYVDSIVNDVLVHLSNEVAKYEGFAGRKFTIAAANVVHHIFCGKIVGALPDGRRAGEPFADGGLSPYYGRNVNGVTSTMRSVAKLELWRASGGGVLNIKFNPNDLKEEFKIESKMRKFASLIKTFAKIGGDIVQFNFVNAETLRDAQKNPEKYRDLLVRVATYSAYFVDLPREIQDDLIKRTEMGGSW
jgi:pyruvate-formate lyase